MSSAIPTVFFFFNDTATTEIYTLSLHDALPISKLIERVGTVIERIHVIGLEGERDYVDRSEEHTSELQSQSNLVCRLLLEKKNKQVGIYRHTDLGHRQADRIQYT